MSHFTSVSMSSSDKPRDQNPAPNGESSGEAISVEGSRYVAGEVAEVSCQFSFLAFLPLPLFAACVACCLACLPG